MTRKAARVVDTRLLRRWPLPAPDEHGDKNARGDVLVIGGTAQTPGAALLAATAALRAGAGRLTVATTSSAAIALAAQLPEARVIPLPQSREGHLLKGSCARLASSLGRCASVLAGPGWLDAPSSLAFTRQLLLRCEKDTQVILDALAMDAVADAKVPARAALLLTPNAGEMARL